MILETVYSINDVPIRLTDERWEYITDNHPDMSGYYDDVLATVETPEYILRGHGGALAAVVTFGRLGFLHVYYRELKREDGFIINAYFKPKLDRKRIIWRRDD
jgi:hypothetical protein